MQSSAATAATAPVAAHTPSPSSSALPAATAVEQHSSSPVLLQSPDYTAVAEAAGDFSSSDTSSFLSDVEGNATAYSQYKQQKHSSLFLQQKQPQSQPQRRFTGNREKERKQRREEAAAAAAATAGSESDDEASDASVRVQQKHGHQSAATAAAAASVRTNGRSHPSTLVACTYSSYGCESFVRCCADGNADTCDPHFSLSANHHLQLLRARESVIESQKKEVSVQLQQQHSQLQQQQQSIQQLQHTLTSLTRRHIRLQRKYAKKKENLAIANTYVSVRDMIGSFVYQPTEAALQRQLHAQTEEIKRLKIENEAKDAVMAQLLAIVNPPAGTNVNGKAAVADGQKSKEATSRVAQAEEGRAKESADEAAPVAQQEGESPSHARVRAEGEPLPPCEQSTPLTILHAFIGSPLLRAQQASAAQQQQQHVRLPAPLPPPLIHHPLPPHSHMHFNMPTAQHHIHMHMHPHQRAHVHPLHTPHTQPVRHYHPPAMLRGLTPLLTDRPRELVSRTVQHVQQQLQQATATSTTTTQNTHALTHTHPSYSPTHIQPQALPQEDTQPSDLREAIRQRTSKFCVYEIVKKAIA